MGDSKIFIGNLDFGADRRDLDDLFYRYGKIVFVDCKRGFGFVEFDDPRDAEDAVRGEDGKDFKGRKLRVEISKPRRRDYDNRDYRDRGDRYDRYNDRGGGRYGDRDGGRYGDRGGGRYNDRRGSRYDRPPRREPPKKSPHRVLLEGLPNYCSWQELKDFFRPAAEATFTKTFRNGDGIAEFGSKEDMEAVLEKLNDTDYKGGRVSIRVDPDAGNNSDDGGRRRRSHSRSRSRSPRRSRSRSPRRGSRSHSPKDRRSRSNSRGRGASPQNDRRSKSRSPSGEKMNDDVPEKKDDK